MDVNSRRPSVRPDPPVVGTDGWMGPSSTTQQRAFVAVFVMRRGNHHFVQVTGLVRLRHAEVGEVRL